MRNKEQHAKSSLNHYHKRRHQLIEQLGGKCVRCGSTENLEFDHIDSNSKEISIATHLSYSMDTIQNELQKCQLLCKSCHIQKTKEEKDAKAKISNQDAKSIRIEYATNNITQKKLGEKYGLKQSEIGSILRGKRWIQHDEDPEIQQKIDVKRTERNHILPDKSIPVDKIDINTGKVIMTYKNLSATTKEGFQTKHVAECCRGIAKQHKGYKWQFHNKDQT